LILQTINPKLVSLDLFSKDLSLTPGQVQQPVATPVESNSGTSSVAPVSKHFVLGPDGKYHSITAAQGEDPKNVDLNNLYSITTSVGGRTVYFEDLASCNSSVAKIVDKNTIKQSCQPASNGPTQYKLVNPDQSIENNFGTDRSTCEYQAVTKGWNCESYAPAYSIVLSGGDAAITNNFTNLTLQACNYYKTELAGSNTIVSDCVKQTKLQ
jgi:hypothetical protein